MSAAVQAVLIERPQYLETRVAPESAEDSVRNLVHELRQPLSSIEAIAYYMEMTLPAEQAQARQYMRTIQDLVGQASSLLNSAASPVRKPCGSAKV